MSILVTGGCGYIGSHIVRQLSEAKHEVIVLDNLSTGSKKALLHNEKLIVADLADSEALDKVFKEHHIDSVIHLAASTIVPESLEQPLKYYANNTLNTLKLIEKCVQYKVKKFVFSSTAAVYGAFDGGIAFEDTLTQPINPYGWSKLMSEQILKDTAQAHEMRYVVLRYFNVAGADPLGRIGQMAPKTTLLITVACEAALGLRENLCVYGTDYATPDGTCIRDYIHVEDLAMAHQQALSYLNEGGLSTTLNVGYGKGHSVKEVIGLVKEVSKVDFSVNEVARREGDPAMLIANSNKITKILSWKPQFNDLEQIIEHAYNWEKAKLKVPI